MYCFDANNTPVGLGDEIMIINDGQEQEGTVLTTCQGNIITVLLADGGLVEVNARNAYSLIPQF